MKTFLATAGLVLASTAAFAQSSPQDFVAMAASGGMYEIRSSEMILETDGLDPEVQEFAEQMIEDHTAAAEELATAAEQSGISVPTEPASREMTMLERLEGAEDKQAVYLSQQNVAHNSAIVLHRAYAASGTDENLQAYAEAAVPVLEEHDSHIEMLHADMASN